MFKTGFLGGYLEHLVAKARNVQNEASGNLLGPFGSQGLKMPKVKLLGASWEQLAAEAQKCSN